jgi:lipid-binding SYLF domain-containing protein
MVKCTFIMNRYFVSAFAALGLVAAAVLPLQATADNKKHEKEINESKATIAEFEKKDPTLKNFFGTAYGYVVFTKIAKGGFILGGAHGKGVVYKQQKVAGFATITQGTIGAQIGGQTFNEVIFLETEATYGEFTNNKLEFAAQATAVAVKSGAAANARYEKGVAIFTAGEKGFMAEASVGGQKFKFEPLM